MSDTSSNELTNKTPTGKARGIFSSRVMKMSLFVILLLALLYIFSVITISALTVMAINSESESAAELVKEVASLLKIDVAGAIGAIMSLVTVRYTLRETSANLKGTSTTEK